MPVEITIDIWKYTKFISSVNFDGWESGYLQETGGNNSVNLLVITIDALCNIKSMATIILIQSSAISRYSKVFTHL